jgi:tetratricopeptide (TPR) repeat protein
MEQSLNALNQKAIKAALKADWAEAIKINEEILSKTPTDISVKLRLGKAYLQASEFTKAKKLFKEILVIDPINKIAQKNYELATNNRKEESKVKTSGVGLIKEPGTSQDVIMDITEKGVTANSFSRGDELEFKILKGGVKVFGYKGSNEVALGTLDPILSNKIYEAKQDGAVIKAQVVSGRDKTISLLIKSSLPIFKARKQETKPYVKKGAIDEDAEE